MRPDLIIRAPMALTLLAVNVAVAILIMLASLIIPVAPPTNRPTPVPNSRFTTNPQLATNN